MPNTVHKIFLHGSKIITDVTLLADMLPEKAQEARNRDYRRSREPTNKTLCIRSLLSLVHRNPCLCCRCNVVRYLHLSCYFNLLLNMH